MRILLTGATGMVGSGVLIECLESSLVTEVVSLSRRSCGQKHPKLLEIIHQDFLDYSTITDQLIGFDACFFCLGVSSIGMSEADYSRISLDYPLALADALLMHGKACCFILVTGAGTDQSMKSKSMWARVKGRAEAGILARPFRDSYAFRPAYIEPMKGVKPSWWIYKLTKPLYPLLHFCLPGYTSTTVEVGRSMLALALHGCPSKIIESRDIVKLARSLSGDPSEPGSRH